MGVIRPNGARNVSFHAPQITSHRECSQEDRFPGVELFFPFTNTAVARVDEKFAGTDDFIQDEVPVTNTLKQAFAKAFVYASRLATTLFLIERLFRLLVEGPGTESRRPVSQWDSEPQRGWVT